MDGNPVNRTLTVEIARYTIAVMFCPECRVEYRPGFTRCSDCDVELVHEIPDQDTRVRKPRHDSAMMFSPKLLAAFISLGWIPAGLLGFFMAEDCRSMYASPITR